MKIAVIGTGIAGVSVAKRLAELPHYQVELFDKGRGTGGRMSVRHTGAHSFDHGVQFFTARTAAFRDFLRDYQSSGVVEEWQPKIATLSPKAELQDRVWREPHFVALPNMNGLCKAIGEELNVLLNTQVHFVKKHDGYWWLKTAEQDFGPYDWVVSTAPPEQTRQMFPDNIGQNMDATGFAPCFSLLLGCSGSLPSWDAAIVKDSPVSWLAFTDRKPGRHSQPSLVAHADGAWSQLHYDTDREEVKHLLVDAVASVAEITHAAAGLHRWRYARVTEPFGQDFWINEASQLAACGDWCLGNRVEDAFTSATRLAQRFEER